MHVIAHHRITDRERFRALAQEPTSGRPLHWRLITSAPTRDGAHCFSLWQVDSLPALQRFLGRALGDTGTVECHEVDDDNAMGLAEMPVTLIRLRGPGCTCGNDFLPGRRPTP